MLQFHYDKVKTVEEGVVRLLTIRDMEIPDFKIEKKGDGFADVLVLRGKRIPLFRWRHDPRMNSMRAYGQKAVAENNCINTSSFVGCDVPLKDLIYAECDIAEYVLGSPIVKVTAFINGAACNLIAKTERGTLANLELGATMAPGTIPQFDHRVITGHGMATDRTVNTITEESGVYLFRQDDPRPYEFNDAEYYLYGLTPEESHTATLAFAIIGGKVDAELMIKTDEHLCQVVDAVYESARTGGTVNVEEV